MSQALRAEANIILRGGLKALPSFARARAARALLSLSPHSWRRAVGWRVFETLDSDDHVPILSGRLAGLSWIPRSAGFECLSGEYERELQDIFGRSLTTGCVVVDIGANVGFFTLLASRIIGNDGSVIAFEPYPPALDYLRRHVALNKLGNVQIREVAVAAAPGRASFNESDHIMKGRLADDGNIEVEVVSVDQEWRSGRLAPPDLMKVDVEGGESAVLRGAEEVIQAVRPVIVVSTHGRSNHTSCREWLRAHDYSVEELQSTYNDPDFDFQGEVVGIPVLHES